MGTEGFEPSSATAFDSNSLGNPVQGGAAKTGAAGRGTDSHALATDDARLARVVEAWPHLSERVRAAVLALVEGIDPADELPG
jgi:hypothetical protein